MSHVAHTHIHERVMSHTHTYNLIAAVELELQWKSHVTRIQETCHTRGESCHIHEGVMAHTHKVTATMHTCIRIYMSHQRAVREWWRWWRKRRTRYEYTWRSHGRRTRSFSDDIYVHMYIYIAPEGSSWVVATGEGGGRVDTSAYEDIWKSLDTRTRFF